MTPIQLDIIKAFGSKELSEGCLIKKNGIYFKAHGNILKYDGRQVKILGHIPHFERILEVLYEKDIAVMLWNMHKRTIVLEFLNEKDEECRIRELEYDWIKQPIEQDEKVLKELLEIFENN